MPVYSSSQSSPQQLPQHREEALCLAEHADVVRDRRNTPSADLPCPKTQVMVVSFSGGWLRADDIRPYGVCAECAADGIRPNDLHGWMISNCTNNFCGLFWMYSHIN